VRFSFRVGASREGRVSGYVRDRLIKIIIQMDEYTHMFKRDTEVGSVRRHVRVFFRSSASREDRVRGYVRDRLIKIIIQTD